jgi:thymidylate synthase
VVPPALEAESPTSRRAVIQIFNAEDNAKRHKEVPCTTALQFLLREGKLHLIANMRSNDAYIGLPHDVFCFTMLQEMVARILGVELGSYRHSVGSMHLYDKNRAAARRYLDEGFQRHVEMPSMPEGDPRPAIRRLFDAERLIRARKRVDAGSLGLHPYWADLVRLLQIHFAQGSEARLDALQEELANPGYRAFVEGRRGKDPLRTVEPAQGTFTDIPQMAANFVALEPVAVSDAQLVRLRPERVVALRRRA